MTDTPASRSTSATRLAVSHITAQNETNLLGTVHGGVVMTLVDSVAGVVAARHSGGPAVTASMDEMVFLVPVRVGDVVHFNAQVNWTGRSSMEVGVRITADRWDSVSPQVHVATAYLVFVAVDAGGQATPGPAGRAGDRRGPQKTPGGRDPPQPPAGKAPGDHRLPGDFGVRPDQLVARPRR